MKKYALLLFALFVTPTELFAAPGNPYGCPIKVKVDVKDLKSVSAQDAGEVDKIYELGEQQTEIPYIIASLEAVNKITNFTDVLKLSITQSSTGVCVFRGSNSKLTLYFKTFSQSARAVLALGYVDYVSMGSGNPTEAHGYQVDLVTPLKTLSATTIAASATKKSALEFELFIQVPLGDYGTDGFEERALVGSAERVRYTVIK